MSNTAAPYLEDPSLASDDAGRRRACAAAALRRLSDALPPPSAPDHEWRTHWENFADQLVCPSPIRFTDLLNIC